MRVFCQFDQDLEGSLLADTTDVFEEVLVLLEQCLMEGVYARCQNIQTSLGADARNIGQDQEPLFLCLAAKAKELVVVTGEVGVDKEDDRFAWHEVIVPRNKDFIPN